MHVVFVAPLTWDGLCKSQFPPSTSSPTDRFRCPARCEMGGLLVLVKKKKRKKKEVDWGDEVEKKGVLHYVLSSQVAICPSSTVPVEQSCVGWRGDDQRPTESSSSSILQPTAASGSIALTTPVTEPHAVEQRPLPDSANYSDPLRGNKRSFNRWENRGVFTRLFGERRDEHCWYWQEFWCLWSKETL